MSALFVVLPLALLVSSLAVAAFVWSVRRGDLDDLVTPALRVLDDDDGAPRPDAALARPVVGAQERTSSGLDGDQSRAG